MTKACGSMDRERTSLGARWARGAAASFPMGRRRRWRSDPGVAHERVSPPRRGSCYGFVFSFLNKPTTWRHQELRQVEDAEKWLPTGVVVLD